MAFDEMAGMVLLLDGRSVGEAWYSRIDPARSAAGIRSVCTRARPVGRARSRSSSSTGCRRRVDRSALRACGLSLADDYRLVPGRRRTACAPAGLRSDGCRGEDDVHDPSRCRPGGPTTPRLDRGPRTQRVRQRAGRAGSDGRARRAAPGVRLRAGAGRRRLHDGTAERAIADAPPGVPVTVVQLSRSFGSHQAITAGLRRSSGDCAIVLGADIQEPPGAHRRVPAQLGAGLRRRLGACAAPGVGSVRSELPSKLFSYLFTRYADLANYPPEGPSGMLDRPRGLDELNRLEESNRNVMALVAWLGFHQTRVALRPAAAPARGVRAGPVARWSSWPSTRSCSSRSMPLRAVHLHRPRRGRSSASSTPSSSWSASLLGVDTPSGWPTILVVVLLLGGIQLTVIGVMGEYFWRAVEETRRRPLYVVRAGDAQPARWPHGGSGSNP